MIHADAVTLKQLRALATIVRAGNLSAAANLLHVTAPAVSTQLKALEANLGAELLKRGPDGKVAPTAIGLEVLATANQIEAMLSLCMEKVSAVRAGYEGHVALGVVSTGKYFAPGLIAEIRDRLPGIQIGFKVGNRGDIIEALDTRQIELAIMGRPPRAPEVEADLLGDHPHVLVAAPDHPLAGRRDISSGELLSETFLCREEGSGTRTLMARFLDQVGNGRGYEQIEIGTNETIKQAVMAGLGIAILSAHTLQAELEAGRLVTLHFRGLPIIRQWFIVHRSDTQLTPAAERIRDLILALDGSYLPDPPA